MNWKPNSVIFTDDAIKYLIDKVSPSDIAGVRTLDNAVSVITNKINFLYHHQNRCGKMIGFNCSFDINQRILFPYTVDVKHIDTFLY